MGYGISIKNQSQYTIIDSDAQYPIFYCLDVADSYLAANASISSFLTDTQLVFARPNLNTGTISYNSNGTILKTTSVGANIRRFKSVTDGGFTADTTGYGINVYNSAGTVIFSGSSSNFNINYDIIQWGTWPSQLAGSVPVTTWIPMSIAEHSLSNSNTYILLNTAGGLYDWGTNTLEYIQEYEFDPLRGTYGSIGLRNFTRQIASVDPDTGDYTYSYSAFTTSSTFIIGHIRN